MKKAFTLAEVMIVLAIIGILVAILLPTAQNLTPDEALMKFQKNNVNLGNAIRNLANSEEYYYNGDFGLDRNNEAIDDPKYFCSALADMLGAKRINCSEDNLGYNTSALANLPDMLTYEMEDGSMIYDYVDCMCKNNLTSGEEIKLNDNTIIYTINPYYHFGSLIDGSDKRLFNLCSNEKRYKFICMDIDGLNHGEEPFGYAIRADGRMIYGSRAQAWLDRKINDNEELPTISSIDSCEPTALSITPEEDTCVAPPTYVPTPVPTPTPSVPEGCGELAMEITADGKDMYIMKFNAGDDALNFGMEDGAAFALPATITNVTAGSGSCTPSETKFCCWSGTTSTDCDSQNGGYNGCTRTVCDWRAANEYCSKLTYLNRTWRLPTSNEWASIGTQLSSISIGKETEGMMLCDYKSGYSSARCYDAERCSGSYVGYCYPGGVWSSDVPGSSAYYYYLNGGAWCGPYLNSVSDAFSVRCVSDL